MKTLVLPALAALALTLPPSAALAQAAADPASPTSPQAQAPQASQPTSDPGSICTDRPTKSNAACVVPAGAWQVETDLFNGAFQRQGGVTTDTWLVTNPTLKYGLSKTLDVEVNIAPYEVVTTHDAAGRQTLDGIGDFYLRLKYSALATGDGALQVSLIPYVKAPTARTGVGNGAWEGGLIAPINLKLSDKWLLTVSPEIDDFRDLADTGRRFNTSQTINLAYSAPHGLTLYGELWADWSAGGRTATPPQYSLDFAVAKALGKVLQVDLGLNLGLNHATPGAQVYTGVSRRW